MINASLTWMLIQVKGMPTRHTTPWVKPDNATCQKRGWRHPGSAHLGCARGACCSLSKANHPRAVHNKTFQHTPQSNKNIQRPEARTQLWLQKISKKISVWEGKRGDVKKKMKQPSKYAHWDPVPWWSCISGTAGMVLTPLRLELPFT